jgi:hypothetical protein
MSNGRGEIIRPGNHIRQKVDSVGGVDPAVAVNKARVVIHEFADGFAEESTTVLGQLEGAMQKAVVTGEPESQRSALFNAALEIRGQSSTFGYPLATAAADGLCTYLDAHQPLARRDVEYLMAFVQAIGAIFRHRLTDDGGQMGAELKKLLAKMATI